MNALTTCRDMLLSRTIWMSRTAKTAACDPDYCVVALPVERIIGLDTEKAVGARTVIRLVIRVLNILESVQALQFLAPVVFISVKGVVLIAMALEAFECIMILGRVNMKMGSSNHRANRYSPKGICKTAPIERLAYTDSRC
jgi:hypothetical protein